jgi:hypothetical protein
MQSVSPSGFDRGLALMRRAANDNAFQRSCLVEQRGMATLLPFLETRAWRGQIIQVAKGPLARHFQKSFGDLLIATGPGAVATVEVKAERRWTGNLFLELWSNKNLDDRASHIERGSTPGWLVTCRADVIGFHFLDVDTALFLPLFRLQQWAFGVDDRAARVFDFPERRQRRYVQRNDTWGRIVPIEVLAREIGMKRAALAQGDLWASPSGVR